MKRLAIFASYDNKGMVHDYVLSYLRFLKEIADKIIFVADNEVLPEEQAKLKNLCCHCEFVRHGEYDFGSYKRGFNQAKIDGLLSDCDELILCNDSCFCEFSFRGVFAAMDEQNCDFWGMTSSNEIKPHLQSYFLVFRKSVFLSEYFAAFINGVEKLDNHDEVILNYEVQLKQFLESKGFIASAFVEAADAFNITIHNPLSLLKRGMPLLKKKFFVWGATAKEKPDEVIDFIRENYPSGYNDILTHEKASGTKLL